MLMNQIIATREKNEKKYEYISLLDPTYLIESSTIEQIPISRDSSIRSRM